jgi:hypothetical protein
MDKKTKLIFALQQVENVFELMKDNPYAGFVSSHVLPLKFEIERQLALLTNTNYYDKIKE